MSSLKVTLFFSTLREPMYMDTNRYEWRKYPVPGEVMHFDTPLKSPFNGSWLVTNMTLTSGAVDVMQLWLEPK